MKTFETPGEWWLPEQPDRRVPGVLRVTSKDGLRVSLFHALSEQFMTQTARYEAIRGSIHQSPLPGGTEVSLFDAFAISRSLRSNGTSAETLVANHCYVGDQYLKAHDAPHQQYVVTYSGLLDWIPGSALERSVDSGRIQVGLGKPVRRSVRLPHVALTFEVVGDFQYATNKATFRDTACIRIQPAIPISYAQLAAEILVPLRNFLSLAIGATSRLESAAIVLSEERTWPETVHSLSVWERQRRRPPQKAVSLQRPLLPPPDSDLDLERLLLRWWNLSDSHGRVIDLVFGLLEEPPHYVEMQFSMASTALDLLAERFAGGNVEAMLLRLGPSICDQLGSAELFVKRWRASREQLWSKTRASGSELFAISGVLTWVLQLSLLRELEVSLDAAAKSPSFRHFASKLGQG